MGLLFGGLMKGLGDGVSSVGQFAAREQAAEEERQMRAQQRMDEIRERAALTAAMRQPTASGGGRPGKSEVFMEDMAPGSMAQRSVANRLGVSADRLAALDANDLDAYNGPQMGQDIGTGERYAKPGTENKSPLTRELFDAKRKMLGDLQAELIFGDAYDDVTKGRRTNQEIDTSSQAMANPKQAGLLGAAMAAGEGKGQYTGQGAVNVFSGEPSKLGSSIINRNEAKADIDDRTDPNARRGGKGGSGGAGGKDIKEAGDAAEDASKDVARAEGALAKLRKDTPIGKAARAEHAQKIADAEAELSAARERKTRVQAEYDRMRSSGSAGGTPAPAAKPAAPAQSRASQFKVIRG